MGTILVQGVDDDEDASSFLLETPHCRSTQYSAVKQEVLALLSDRKPFKIFFHGVQFKVFIDLEPLKWMLQEPDNDMIRRWLNELENYSLTIYNIAGKEKGGTNGPSRIKNAI